VVEDLEDIRGVWEWVWECDDLGDGLVAAFVTIMTICVLFVVGVDGHRSTRYPLRLFDS
jgi:hypothetical protein